MRLNVGKMTENFLVEAKVTESVDDVTRRTALIHNIRLRVRRLVAGVRELVKYGPMKPSDKFGLSELQINAKGNEALTGGTHDPLGMRVGKACDPTVGKTLEKCCVDAENLVANSLAERRIPTDLKAIEEAINNLKGGVMMAYPMGLPAWDVVRLGIENDEELAGCEDSKHVVDPDTAVLWFAGKAMIRQQVMSKYVGKNDKCTVKAKLEAKGAAAPAREPAIDEDTRRKMMAKWHKKKEEQEKLAEDDDDAFSNSVWANPKAMKNDISGVGSIKFRPGM